MSKSYKALVKSTGRLGNQLATGAFQRVLQAAEFQFRSLLYRSEPTSLAGGAQIADKLKRTSLRRAVWDMASLKLGPLSWRKIALRNFNALAELS
jgi:hypothetical protein